MKYPATLMAGIGIFLFLGCQGVDDGTFVIKGAQIPGGIERALKYHGGAKSYCDSKDLDGDKIDDYYVHCEDGTLLYAPSKDPRNKERPNKRFWYTDSEELLDHAVTGTKNVNGDTKDGVIGVCL